MAESVDRKSRTISVQALARVEGEGALTIKFHDGQVQAVELRIYEPPRFYEAFLRGRAASEVPDITSRICGICPVAYQMSSVHALENIPQLVLSPSYALGRCFLRRVDRKSHAAHLHAACPRFLGFEAPSRWRKQDRYADIVRHAHQEGGQRDREPGGRREPSDQRTPGGFYRAASTRWPSWRRR